MLRSIITLGLGLSTAACMAAPPPASYGYGPAYPPPPLAVAGPYSAVSTGGVSVGAAGSAVSSMSAGCGPAQYSVELRRNGAQGQLLVAVNGRPLPGPEMAKVLAAIPAGFMVSGGTSLRCVPGGAELAFTAIPAAPGAPMRISFVVSPGGAVDGVRRD